MGEFLPGGMAGLLALVLGYLSGSIPFGLILTRLAGTVDIREIGSKSIGATNVLRTGRRDLAAATVLLDALKGTIPVLIAMKWGIGPAVLAGVGAFIGHLYPVWLKFAGGKGVATYIGVLLGLWWPGLLIFAVVWLTVAFVTRYSSASALAASVVVPVSSFFLVKGGMLLPLALSGMAVLLWIRHRANIERLLAGTEGKIGQKG